MSRPGGLVAECAGCDARLDAEDRFCPLCGDARGRMTDRDTGAAVHRTRSGAGRSFRCNGCGAAVTWSAERVTLHCAFCGSGYVEELAPAPGRERPTSWLPFAVGHERARERFRKWTRRGWLRPSDFSHAARTRHMTPVLLPCWRFDADMESYWACDVDRTGHPGPHRQNDWYPASGHHEGVHRGILVPASGGLTGDELAEVSPFPADGLVPWPDDDAVDPDPPEGWIAEEPMLTRAEARPRGLAAVRRAEEEACAAETPGRRRRKLKVAGILRSMEAELVLVPVWVGVYRYRDRAWRLLINGATGEVISEAPVSWWKIAALVAAILGGAGLLVAGLLMAT